MRSIEANGKSIDEAIFNGLMELGISIDEVEIEIVQQESKGVFGLGSRPAVVRLIEREPEDVVLPDYVVNGGVSQSTSRDRDRSRGSRDRGGRDRHSRADRPDCPDRADRTDRMDRSSRSDGDRPKYEVPEEYTAENAQDIPAAAFLAGMLEHMQIPGTVLAAPASESGIKLYIQSPTNGVLIGHRGETLDALQYLTSLHVNRSRKEEGYTRVTLDTEGYREKREETLTRLAKRIASQVKSTGRARTLEPMNPYERRVLHATLQNNPYVTTHSEGEEPNRRVVIEPKR